jgi:hypothetical protein
MNRSDASGEFERWLDSELGAALARELGSAAPPPPFLHRLGGRPLGRRGVAGLGVRGAAAVFAVVLAVAGGGAALATGSPNPVSWGQQMVQAVSSCADHSGGEATVGVRANAGRCLGAPARPVPVPDAAPAPPAAQSPARDSNRPEATDEPAGEPPDDNAGRSTPADHGGAGAPADQGGQPKAKDHSPASSAGKNSDH